MKIDINYAETIVLINVLLATVKKHNDMVDAGNYDSEIPECIHSLEQADTANDLLMKLKYYDEV
jgi:hypothetical protein